MNRRQISIAELLLLIPFVATLRACGGSDTPPGTGGSTSTGTTSHGVVGYPCLGPDELDPAFAGFKLTEASIVVGSEACPGAVCLVNHFQGRATCPRGQDAPTPCTGPGDTSCPEGECVPACAEDVASCQQFVCHLSGDCQTAAFFDDPNNAGKACCAPGTDTPVATAVCGQCDAASRRSADNAVYCTCRCGLADGAPDTGAPLCDCPTGFTCTEIQPYLGLGDEDTAGKYCIKENTKYTSSAVCGTVKGHYDPSTCAGIPAP